MNQDLINTVKLFRESVKWALVVGDLMLDRYLIGDVQRISPEAPVPVVLLKQQNDRAGGAANVAANLASLGITTRIAGCVGEDAEASTLLALINHLGIKSEAVIQSSARPTIAKTRVMSTNQQIVRIDQESQAPLSDEENSELHIHITRATTKIGKQHDKNLPCGCRG
jgi:D-beta-D-heptose 7-phosphate kinase/D-beta-D-heptose 1-phosphate adenosyltransferase